MNNKLTRSIGFVSAVAFAMVSVHTPQPVQAYATGCSIWKEVPYYGIPTGWLCFTVEGDNGSTSIDSMRATWRTSELCDWRIDWVIYYRGKTWWRENGPEHNHCDHVTAGRARGKGSGPDGSKICAELYDTNQNTPIEAVCHRLED
jgi:hypothetical protein